MIKKIKVLIARLFNISAVCDAFENAFATSKKRGWPEFFVAVDLHHTVLYPDYEKEFVSDFYPHAKEVMRQMSERDDIILIMYTCSHPGEIEKYKELFSSNGIDFKYVNENLDVKNTKYGDFSGKPYMNVLLEDKAGFDAEEDWKKIKKLLKKYPKNYLK